MTNHPSRPWIRQLVGSLVLALFYGAGAKLGFLLAIEQTNSTPFWPPAGIALAGLLILGWRLWPGVWLGAFAANSLAFAQAHSITATSIPWVSGLIACGNTLEAIAGWFLCVRWLGMNGQRATGGGRSIAFGEVSILRFVTVALAVSLVGAGVGPAVLGASHSAPWQDYPLIAFTWWSGDATGILYTAPFLLVGAAALPALRTLRLRLQTVLAFALMTLSCAVVFLGHDSFRQAQELKFIIIGPMVWIAARSGMLGTTAALMLLGIFVILGLQHQIGHAIQDADFQEVIVVQAFLWVVGVTCLTLARKVTTLRAAQASSRESERTLAATLRAIPAFVWVAHDPECRKVTGNPAAQGLLELSTSVHAFPLLASDSVVPPYVVALHGRTLRPDELPMRRAVAIRQPILGAEMDIVPSHGGVRHLYGNAVPLFDAAGAVSGCVGAFVDITMQKLAERALQRSEERFRSLAEHAPVGIFRTDARGAVTYINESWCRMAGLTVEQAIGDGWRAALHPDDRAQIGAYWDQSVERGALSGAEFRFARRDGSMVWVQGSAVPLRDGGGAIAGYIGTISDISVNKRAEAALREKEAELRLITNLSPVMLVRITRDFRYVFVNEPYARRFGLAPEEIIGKRIPEVIGVDAFEAVRPHAEVVFRGEVADFELEVPYAALGKRHVHHSLVPDRDDRGNVIGLIGAVSDITIRKQAEAALREADQKLRLHFEQSPMAVIEWDVNFRVARWNPAARTIFGYSSEEALGQHASFIVPERYRAHVEQIWQALLGKSGGERSTNENLRKDGGTVLCEWFNTPLIDGSGTFTGAASVVQDVTERRRAEEALNASVEFSNSLIRSMPDGFSVLGPDGLQLEANPALCRMTGFSHEELVGREPPFPYWPPEEHERLQAAFHETLSGRFNDFELIFMRKDGERFPVIVSPSAIKNRDDNTTSYIATVKDITARKKMEEALATTADLLERTGEMAKVGGWEMDLATMKRTWSLATCRIMEVEPSGVPPLEQALNLVAPEARPIMEAAVRAAIDHATPYDLELPAITAKGRAIWVRAQGHVEVENGKAVKLVGALHDITERRQAERLLEWEKSALELISSAMPLGDVLDGLMHGLEKQLPDSLCSVLLLAEDGTHLRHGAAPSLPGDYNRAVDGGAIGPVAGSCGTAAFEGRQVIVEDIGSDPLWAAYRGLALGHGLRACHSTPIFGNEGKILGTFAIYYREPRLPLPAEHAVVVRAVHITRIAIERKQAEAALRESETKFRALFESAGDAIFLMEGEKFIDCNARALAMFGCESRDQIMGQPPYRFSPPMQPAGRDSREFAIEKLSAALSGRPQFFEWMHTKLDGTPFPADVSLNAVALGGRMLVQGIVHDITERRRAEQELQRLNEELELRVAARTSALSEINDELNHEIIERRRLEKDLITISEQEQRRLGEDVHERLGSQLAGMGFLCQVLASRLRSEAHPRAGDAAELNVLLKQSLDVARSIAHSSYPVDLETGGLFAAVQGLADRTSQVYGIDCELRCKRREILEHGGGMAIHIYRIIQEAVTNAIKHGRAASIIIECRLAGGVGTISITNDGAAFEPKEQPAGMGLHLMRYRARLIGGEIEMRRPDKGGCEVRCTFKVGAA
jgi:PAS domain S-box-containing protein